MSELYERSIIKLELDLILSQLADCADSGFDAGWDPHIQIESDPIIGNESQGDEDAQYAQQDDQRLLHFGFPPEPVKALLRLLVGQHGLNGLAGGVAYGAAGRAVSDVRIDIFPAVLGAGLVDVEGEKIAGYVALLHSGHFLF